MIIKNLNSNENSLINNNNNSDIKVNKVFVDDPINPRLNDKGILSKLGTTNKFYCG